MINEEQVKELVLKGNWKLDHAGREDFFEKHPHYSPEEVKECFLEGIYCKGHQIYATCGTELLEQRRNNNYVLHNIKTNLLFPKTTIIGYYVKDNVVIFHIGPMSKYETDYYKASIKQNKKKLKNPSSQERQFNAF